MAPALLGGEAGSRGLTGAEMEDDAGVRAMRYRRQAAEILRTAEEITDSGSRATLVRLAETYARLAELLEQSSTKTTS
jgi:hypothetical protein